MRLTLVFPLFLVGYTLGCLNGNSIYSNDGGKIMTHRRLAKEIIPAERITLITPSDTATIDFAGIPMATRGISIVATGTLRVLTVHDEDVTIPDGALAAGVIHPMAVKRVYSTGTTATGIVGYA